MPRGSYRVGSPVYIAPPSFVKVTPAKIAPESIVSMQELKNTVVSHPYELDKPSKPYIVRENDGSFSALHVTSNNHLRHKVPLIDYHMHDDFSPQPDDTKGFNSWKAAGEKYGPSHFAYVKLPETTARSGVAIGFERPAYFDIRDTWIPKYSSDLIMVDTHNNKLGKRLSEIQAKVKEPLTNYLRTEDGRELTNSLKLAGHQPKNIDYLAVGFLGENDIYGVIRTNDGKIFFTGSKDTYDKITRDARLLGVKYQDLLDSIMAEEIAHIWRDMGKDGDIVDIEMATKHAVAEHYSRLAKNNDGDPKKAGLRRRYEKLAAIKRFDEETTPQRYAHKASLRLMLEMDAMEKGLEGKAIAEYVEGRMAQIEAEDSPRMSSLERIAEKGPGPAEKEAPKEAMAETAE